MANDSEREITLRLIMDEHGRAGVEMQLTKPTTMPIEVPMRLFRLEAPLALDGPEAVERIYEDLVEVVQRFVA